ncbi:30S ribosomal protein S20 [Candidatus Azambacteria bacterium]|nr:30S ribosomal protein S20 [Candidatus Azambacteria bacterium]
MPRTKSAKKALRQSVRRRKENLRRLRAMRTFVKAVRKAAAARDAKTASSTLPKAFEALDKAAKTGVIKKNTASRLKSRLAKLVAKS